MHKKSANAPELLGTVYDTSNSTKPPASGGGNFNQPRLMSQVGSVVQMLTYQLQSCDSGNRTIKYARLALKGVRQNDGDFVEVILLYTYKHVFIYTEQLSVTIILIFFILIYYTGCNRRKTASVV